MAARSSIHVSDELAEEALHDGLEDRSWRDLLEYGRKNGAASGYTEEDVPEIVRNRRNIIAQSR